MNSLAAGRLSRSARTTLAVVLAAGLMTAVAPATKAAADSSTPTTAAVLGPLLNIFMFGSVSGVPLACGLAASLISTGADQVNAGAAVSPLVNEINTVCNDLSTQGTAAVTAAIAKSKALVFVNPLIDPAISALSNGATAIGTGQSASVAPFGPTISGLGGTIAFFEGA